MPVYVKEGALGGGSWRQIADGNLRFKKPPWEQDPNTWFSPSFTYVNVGGSWRDTGYRGKPLPPSALWVAGWDYFATTVQWNGPGSGPDIVAWHIERRDVNGTPVEGYVQSLGNKNFKTPQDTRHQFYVRSVGASGLYSDWAGPLRVGIGHPETYNYGYVQRYRYYETPAVNGLRNANDPFAVIATANVHFEAMHWRNLSNPNMSVISPYGSRTVNWFLPWISAPISDALGQMNRPHSYDMTLNNWGDSGAWGIVARGSGWSTHSDPALMLYCDNFWLSGTEVYQNYEIVSTNPAQANYYW